MVFYFSFLYLLLIGMPMPNPNIGMPMPNPGGLYGAAPSMPQPGGGYSGNLSFGVSINIGSLVQLISTCSLYACIF